MLCTDFRIKQNIVSRPDKLNDLAFSIVKHIVSVSLARFPCASMVRVLIIASH